MDRISQGAVRHGQDGQAGQAEQAGQLVVGDRTGGVSGGRWRWQGTRLFYENGEQTNQGLFYSCADVNGLNGLFLFLQA